MDIGVVVGRFQVDALHDGHRALINFVKGRHPNVLVFIGVAPLEGTKSDPLSYQLREQMVRSLYPDATILPIYDTFYDLEWSKNLDNTIKRLYYGSTVMLYCGEDGFKRNYHGEFEVVVSQHNTRRWSGTEVRERIAKSPQHQASFRAGVIHQTGKPYVNVKMCVDIAPTSSDQVLLGKKNGEEGWRFIGGQVDPEDISLEAAAARELREETGMTSASALLYVGSFKVGDWRNKGTGLSTFTALYEAPHVKGTPRPQDDIDEVKWFSLDTKTIDLLVSEHRPLFKELIDFKYGD